MSYPSDLTDDVLEAIFYRVDQGIQGRAMPINFPAWQPVYTAARMRSPST